MDMSDVKFDHQMYIISGIIDTDKTEAQAFERAQRGLKVMVHYHAYEAECNDDCHIAKVQK